MKAGMAFSAIMILAFFATCPRAQVRLVQAPPPPRPVRTCRCEHQSHPLAPHRALLALSRTKVRLLDQAIKCVHLARQEWRWRWAPRPSPPCGAAAAAPAAAAARVLAARCCSRWLYSPPYDG